MPVDYADWISIAFEVAKAKGADFSTSQEEIQNGTAPSSSAIQVFAEIWNDRKGEMATMSDARRIARSEIEV